MRRIDSAPFKNDDDGKGTGMSAAVRMIALLVLSAPALAQVDLTGTPVSQNFDTLANTGTSGTLPTGWAFLESGTGANTTYTATDGSAMSGDTYSAGAANASDRALGGIGSNSTQTRFGVQLRNQTGSPLTTLTVNYVAEQWRLGDTVAADKLDFEYSTDATSLANGTWTAVDPLDVNSPVNTGTAGPLVGNDAANKVAVAGDITGLNIANGSTFWIRWVDPNVGGADDLLAIDDVLLSTTPAIDFTPDVLSTVPANNATGVNASANLVIQFTEAVTTNAGWFTLDCGTGNLSYQSSGSGASRTIDPDLSLPFGASCTGTVIASLVLDQDSPIDPMTTNRSFTFTVAPDTAPAISSSVPVNGASNVDALGNLSIEFNEPVTTNSGWFALTCNSQSVLVNESGSGTSRTLDPVSFLPSAASCTATIDGTRVFDQDGTIDAMGGTTTITFTVATDVAPTIASTNPAAGANNVSINSNVVITFSEPVSTSGSWFAITCASSGAHPAVVTGGPTAWTLNPNTDFSPSELCTVSLTANLIADLDGNPDALSGTAQFQFTIGAGYYSGVDSSNATALRSTLHNTIDDHTRIAYTNGTPNTWAVLNLADQDPMNTNAILDVYKNATYTKIPGGQGPYNREHTWPNSLGFGDNNDSAPPNQLNYPYTDTHMLYASDVGYNSNRGNKYYGNCDASCTEDPTLLNHGQGGGSGVYPGNSNWYNGVLYEVWNARKGDMARAMFYMDIRYEGGTHGVTGAPEPDLRLTDTPSEIVNTGGNASVGYMGLRSVLLQWHAQDPVTEEEVLRNDIVFSFQGNRNPFIDHPEWVACIYQSVCSGSPPDNVFASGFE